MLVLKVLSLGLLVLVLKVLSQSGSLGVGLEGCCLSLGHLLLVLKVLSQSGSLGVGLEGAVSVWVSGRWS